MSLGHDWVMLTCPFPKTPAAGTKQEFPLGFEEVFSVTQEFRKMLAAPYDGVLHLFLQ